MVDSDGRIFAVRPDSPLESWEVAVAPLPLWLPVEGRRSRAWLAVCSNANTERLLASEPGGEEEIPQLLEHLLTRAERSWRTTPARVQVADAEVARILEGLLDTEGVEVELVTRLSRLPEVVEALIASLVPPDPRPGPLTGEGVTVERLRSFALAAATFYDSTLGRHLTSEDLIRIEAPEAKGTLRYASLSRQGTKVTGLWFFENPEDLEDLLEGDLADVAEAGRGFWTLDFDQPWTAPPEDVEIWERYGLPWAGGTRCPSACFMGPGAVRRPDARQLAFLEGLLATLAVTAEEDLDTGRWEKNVETAEGTVRFVLSLPGLLEPEEGGVAFSPQEGPETPRERAQELLIRAHQARGRRVLLLARQALEIWPDCADAYSLMASRAPDSETALELYAQAAGHYQEMLRLNPNENQEVRASLVNILIVLNRDEEAIEIAGRYEEDGLASMAYPRALLRFRRDGDSLEARRLLKLALKANRFVPALLRQTRKVPPLPDFYSPGNEAEAGFYVMLSRGTWTKTPGALDWLRERTATPVPSKARGKAKSKSKKKKRR